jgi:hypothetical protein
LQETEPEWSTFSVSFKRPYVTADAIIDNSSQFYWARADDTGFLDRYRDIPSTIFRMHDDRGIVGGLDMTVG